MIDQQLLAIQERNTNILVSASAGAGKTYMLIERLANRIMQDKIPVDRILAVTFTKAAADEMKNRLAKKLNEIKKQMVQDHTISESDLIYLEQQLANLSKAEISTIDSFCLNLIKKYYFLIGLNPSCLENTLSSAKETMLKKQAFQNALQKLYSQSPDDFFSLSYHFQLKPLSDQDESPLEKCVHAINDIAKSSLDYQSWLKQALSFYPVISSFNDYPVHFKNIFFNYQKNIIYKLTNICSAMEEALIDNKKTKAQEKLIIFKNLLSSYQKIADKQEYIDWTNFIKQLAKLSFRVMNNEAFKACNEEFKKIRNDLEDSLIEEKRLVKEAPYLHQIVTSLILLVKETEIFYQQAKREENTLDFSDMAIYAMDILQKNDGLIAHLLQNKYAEIMIDEFQDTSTLQNKILCLISNGHNLFRVGDLKQSIYGFRNARPELMASILETKKDKIFHLEHNYRSKDHIVKFTNKLFTQLFNYPSSSVCYGPCDQVTIGKKEQMDTSIQKVSLIHIAKEANDKLLAAKWITHKIISLHENNNIAFKDICVLCPSHGDKKSLKTIFDTYNIPYSLDAKQGFFKSFVVQIVLSIVSYFNEENDDLDFIAILQSPLFNFQDIDIVNERLAYNQSSQNISFSSFILSRKKEINDVLLQLKSDLLKDPLIFLSSLSRMNNFYNCLSYQQKTNFDFLCQKVKQEQIHYSFHLYKWLKDNENEYSTESNAHLQQEDLVKVETIHHSKGLQYGVVFLYECDASKDEANPFILSNKYGIGLDYQENQYLSKHPSLIKYFIKKEEQIKKAEEFLRLAYVSVTRAVDKLYIVSTLSAKKVDSISLSEDFILNNSNLGLLTLAALGTNDTDIYHYELIEELNEEKEYLSNRKYFVQDLPHYENTLPIMIKKDNPSQHQQILKDLDFQKNHHLGQSFGTLAHSYLAKLTNKKINLNDININLPLKTKEAIVFFQNHPWIQKILHTMHVQRELSYYIEDHFTYAMGIVDFIATKDNKAIIIDYKTDCLNDDNEFITRYQSQLQQYQQVFKHQYTQVETWIYALHLQRFIQVS